MGKYIKIRMILLISVSFIFGIMPYKAFTQPEPPDTWPPYASKTYTTIKTPKGENLEAILYTDKAEWVDYWEDYGAYLIWVNSWDATRKAAATHEYNCHGYAWYVSEGGSNVCINATDRYGNPNLLKYWTGEESYIPAASSTKGRKVLYTNDDHSAITTESVSYVKSKWGQLPLYRHLKSDCPYTSTNLIYYKLNPNMTGSESLLCYNVQRTFNTNITHMSGATLTWTKGPHITYVSGAGTPAYTVKGSGNGDSYVNFQITTPSGFSWSSSKNFWAGKPNVPQILGPVELNRFDFAWYFLDGDSKQWGDFDWSTSSHFSIKSSTNGYKLKVQAIQPGSGWIHCDVSNVCGTTLGQKFVAISGSRGLMINPNPADTYLDIDIYEEEMKVSELNLEDNYVLRMFDKTGMIRYTDQFKKFPYRINTTNLPEGLYIIQLIYGGETFSIQVVIEH